MHVRCRIDFSVKKVCLVHVLLKNLCSRCFSIILEKDMYPESLACGLFHFIITINSTTVTQTVYLIFTDSMPLLQVPEVLESHDVLMNSVFGTGIIDQAMNTTRLKIFDSYTK